MMYKIPVNVNTKKLATYFCKQHLTFAWLTVDMNLAYIGHIMKCSDLA